MRDAHPSQRFDVPRLPELTHSLRWAKPEPTGPYTSPRQTISELRGGWRAEGGARAAAAWEGVRRGYLANERKWDAALGEVLRGMRTLGLWETAVLGVPARLTRLF